MWTARGQRSRVAHRLPTLSRLSPTIPQDQRQIIQENNRTTLVLQNRTVLFVANIHAPVRDAGTRASDSDKGKAGRGLVPRLVVEFGHCVHGADIRWVSLEGSLERGQQQHAVEAGTATPVSRRSFEGLQIEDLRRLAASAMENQNRFVGGNRWKYGWCENHLLMLCLCQGAAEHYVRGERGVKDFDVWAFYEAPDGGEAVPLATLQHRKLRALEVREKPVRRGIHWVANRRLRQINHPEGRTKPGGRRAGLGSQQEEERSTHRDQSGRGDLPGTRLRSGDLGSSGRFGERTGNHLAMDEITRVSRPTVAYVTPTSL